MSELPLVRIHAPGIVTMDSVETPEAGPDDVLVAVCQCGICGSDLGYAAMGGLPGYPVPMPLGHELAGVVREVGSRVQGFAPGDRVVVNPTAGGNAIGNGGAEGGFAPLLLVRGVNRDTGILLLLPDTLSDEQGALVEPLSVAMHAVNRSELVPTDKLVIFGAGPIGLGVLLVARYVGLSHCVVVDRSAKRLALAEQLGATPVHVDREDVAARLGEVFGNVQYLGQTLPDVDVLIDATGVGAVFEQCVQLARFRSRITVVGVHKAPCHIDLLSVLARELRISGSMAYPDEFPAVIEMLASGRVDASALISHRFPLSQFDQAFALAGNAGQAVKVMVDCQR